MAFKPTTITEEESSEIQENLSAVITDSVTEVKENIRRPTIEERKQRKPRKKASRDFFVDMESAVKDSGIDYNKWNNYKNTVLIKPIQVLEDPSQQNIGLPSSLLQRLNELTKYSRRVHAKTIVANLIVDFLERNGDIIQLLDKEYNKKSK